MKYIYYDNNFMEVQTLLGKRPGDYRLDPYYLKKGHGMKPMFWEAESKKWRFVHVGDRFAVHDDGTVEWESVRK